MKRLLLILTIICASPAYAQVKVNSLPNGTTPVSGDYAICDQSGTTNKCTFSQVATGVSNILGLGTFATQNYATPPAIGGVTPAAGNFTSGGFSSTFTLSGITGETQCLHASSSGIVTGTGLDCVSGGSGTVGSGTAGQLAGYASAGTSVAGQSLGGDCSIDSSFDITCTESDGVTIVTTTGTQTLTNKSISATEVNSGTMAAAQMPALTGDCTTSAGAVTTTCTKTSGTAFSTLATTAPGTGVTTALGVAVGSVGSVVTNGGALGTPSSGIGTNLTGTASGLNIGGNAATATNLASYPTLCSGGQFSEGLSSGSNNCATPSGSGTVTTTGSPASSYLSAFSGTTSITGTANATLSAGALTLGVSGTSGSVKMGNATSGTVTLAPVTGALGTVTASLPANTGTLSELNLAQTFTAVQTFDNSDFRLLGSSTGYNTFTAANSSSTDYTTTIPAATDTVAELTQTQTLTNKMISGASNTLSNVALASLASQAANTIVMNATGSSASPTAVAVASAVQADLAASTAFTVAGTGCTPTITTGTGNGAGPFAGTIQLASGPCTAVTITINGATGFTAPHGYHCTAHDKTLQAAGTWFGTWGESASTTTTVTIPIPGAAATTDVISVGCDYF